MPDIPPAWRDRDTTPFDFVLVGAGAGGAPLAARLAERGYTVLVCEMGPEKPATPPGRIENTEVPLLHGEVTEDERHSLRYFVQHYDTPPTPQDPKWYTPPAGNTLPHPGDETGVFYPRAQGVGGCTVHNAMITVSGPSEDWDRIADATGDESWRGERMRAYFQRVENCHYNRPSRFRRFLKMFGVPTGWEDGRHGRGGWLDTTVADFGPLLNDARLLKVVLNAIRGALKAGVTNLWDLLRWGWFTDKSFPNLDPNHWRRMRQGGEGLARIPCAITPEGTRSGPREHLLKAKAAHPTRLTLLTGVLVTKLEFADTADGERPRVVGVRVLPKEHAYEADPNFAAPGPEVEEVTVCCRREVVLCGGAFNTPQLLMLSGIGPVAHLKEHGIEPVVDLAGVGENLQDRYEVPVVATVRGSFASLAGLGTTSRPPVADEDPQLKKWKDHPNGPAAARGLYATNGGLIALLKRSRQEDNSPDLFIFALAGYFPGYHVGYSKPAAFSRRLSIADAARDLPPDERTAQDRDAARSPHRTVTWLLLKARTRHHGGEVRLRDASPFRRPAINFRSFPLGAKDLDADALVEGVKFVRDYLDAGVQSGLFESHDCPDLKPGATDDELHEWVRRVAWGHHACGTCRIGPMETDGVVDSRFRVHGVDGLRVADASVFPRIPGIFIVANVYMAAEKAADVLSEDHRLPGELPEECVTALAANPVLRSRPEYEQRRVYPAELEAAEAALVAARRAQAGL